MLERTLHAEGGNRRIRIVRREDGLFHMLEDFLSYDEEDDVTYWSNTVQPLPGIYESADLAESEARSRPGYGDQISN